jgi:AcrR family transcriptional regulator
MPYPSRIDAESIVGAARQMIEADGVENLSLNKLAKALNVSAPSLYRYFDGKAALLRAVNADTTRRLFAAMHPALEHDGTPGEKAMLAADYYRAFAFENPATYGLLFTNTVDALRPDETENVQRVLPYQRLIAQISGEADSLTATRGFLALMHGFVMLVLAGQLRRGGDLDAAYERSVRAYLDGWRQDTPSV